MLVGYARVSTLEQSLDVQITALKKYGVASNHIYAEKFTGKTTRRPKLQEMLNFVRDGDTVVLYKLDRLARNMRESLNVIHNLYKNGVTVVILTPKVMKVDTHSVQGKMFMDTLLMFADIERQMIIDRTQAGKDEARAKGKNVNGGRPNRLHDDKRKAHYKAINDYFKSHSAKQTAVAFNCSPRTVYYVRSTFRKAKSNN